MKGYSKPYKMLKYISNILGKEATNRIYTNEAILEARRRNSRKFKSIRLVSRSLKINMCGSCSLCGLDVNPLWFYPKSTDGRTNGPVYLCIGCKTKKEKERKKEKIKNKSRLSKKDKEPIKKVMHKKYDDFLSIEVNVETGGLNNNYLRFPIPPGFFPEDAYGGSNRSKSGKSITVFFEGPDKSIETDIDSGHGRIRDRSGIKIFYRHHNLKANDLITITKTDERSYKISSPGIIKPVLCKSREELNVATSKLRGIKGIPSGQLQPEKCKSESDNYIRDAAVVAYVLNSAKGICECCMSIAPFCKDNGAFFLEVHHVHFLSEGGTDTIDNAVAVCPNCHKELHFGENRQSLKDGLYKKSKRLVKTKEIVFWKTQFKT
jgi:5-methylcytosine-specific restriction endonuclease McrA